MANDIVSTQTGAKQVIKFSLDYSQGMFLPILK